MLDHRCILAECGDNMRGIDLQRFDHLADGMLPLYALVFPDYFCDRLCGAVVGHGITWKTSTRIFVYANFVSSEIIYLIYGQRVVWTGQKNTAPHTLRISSAIRLRCGRLRSGRRTGRRNPGPLLIYGKPGIGKTSTAYALANDMNWEVIELNASDQRTAAVIERIAGAGSMTASLTGSSRKLVVLDEADNLQGTADRGGAKAIIECIRQAQQPMILIANDLYGLSPEIRARCEPVQFKAVPARSIAPRLKYLCAAEKIACSDAAIHAIAESAEGDIRSAVNMLYASAIGRDRLDDEQVHTSQKDERVSIFSLITALFGKSTG